MGEVPLVQTTVEVKEKVPYFNLKVPQAYRLQSYQPHNVFTSSGGYVAPRLAKPLRSGAEDEVKFFHYYDIWDFSEYKLILADFLFIENLLN